MGRPGKGATSKSNGQTQEDKENVHVARHVPADGKEPANVKSI